MRWHITPADLERWIAADSVDLINSLAVTVVILTGALVALTH